MNKQKKLGMPYMGSKRKLSQKIVDEILNANPNTKYFYDLFGGGGAVSFEAVQRPRIEKVFYNELNKGVVELLKKVINDGVTDELFKFIDRETFFKHKDDDDWFGGLCKVVWSFGNSQRTYLFGKGVEPIKKLGHEVIVNKDRAALRELSSLIGVDLPEQIMEQGITKNRHLLARMVEKELGSRDAELQHLEGLQQLDRIHHLEQIGQLELSSKSYNEVEITTPIDETIIYLDPPYEDTTEYQKVGLNHRELDEWIKNSPYKIYVSSYKFNLPKIASFKHTTSLSATSNNKVTENLYCNKAHKDLTRLF